MQAIPLPPAPQLDAAMAYGLAGGAVLVGLLFTFFGCRLHYLLAAAVGAGAGFALTPVVQRHLDINPAYVQIAVVLITAAVLAIASRVTWAVAAGALGVAVAATVLLLNQAAKIPEEASQSLTAWWQCVAPAMFDLEVLKEIWHQQQGLVLLAVFPAGVLPLLLGIFFNRAVITLMTALIGAAAIVAGLVVGLAQLNGMLWPKIWTDVAILALAAAVIMLIGAVCQCLFAQARKNAKKQKQDKTPADTST